ncbi:hypothetical protein N7478_010053 [Penicillium angulare]|uniref:uncharacterized protein n=1 Tax=Penicillium angulare TaxID=116970 RepID=UPI002540237D|nr:uncharacterized protein N7478_010053 [Penicillium angulare]KAJ5267245.1 hypothetical protein N7478_010053 [Penicillium angulare]
MACVPNEAPPDYAECIRDSPLDISSHPSRPSSGERFVQVPPPTTSSYPETPHHARRSRRLRQKVAKGLKLAVGATVMAAAVPVNVVGNAAYEGGKAALQIVAAPVLVCVFCLCVDDFDY